MTIRKKTRSLAATIITFGSLVGGANGATLVTHWQAENNFLDSTVNGHHATQTGTVGFRTGGADTGMGFDLSAGNYLDVTTLAGGAELAGGSLAVSSWFQEDSAANSGSIINLRSTGNDSGFTLEPQFNNAGTVLFVVFTADGAQSITADGFTVGQRHHVTGVFDSVNQTIAIYRDGVLVASTATASNAGMRIDGDETLRIGRNIVNSIAFDGMADEVKIFDGSLTATEVQELVPEPSSAALLGLGCLSLAFRRSRL